MSVIHRNACPVCGASSIQPVLEAIDRSVSRKVFSIWECGVCSLRFTQDIPDQFTIGQYYQTENYISHSDTRTGVVNRLYHQVRKITLQSKRKLIERECRRKTGTLLDIGAGTGAFANVMKSAGWSVTGLEPDPGARAVAEANYGIRLEVPDKLYQLEPAGFDAITLWHVLEHVHDLQAYMGRFKTLLKPGGRLFLALPNWQSADAAHYGSDWAAYDVPRHLYHFSPAAVKQLLQRNGFRLNRMQPMWFDPFYIAMLSEKYQHGKTRYFPAAWNGMISDVAAWKSPEKASSVIYICSL
ncbi:class I SAM-dependent methyltransferase [Flavihumibacter petaseus]|uniref:Putative methyltransferase n=1 Tax=Flavihumibacter petaseus NBRC 106054 TaxID=1220578 RepID=A0A0E9N4J1_9BACT|nr:class I SAM-dependent methyltransferase [Flavihumibacter petaseus]GAO44285.1 putative methyltransferase [Flavihumibacter petaseus NBRC 106054]